VPYVLRALILTLSVALLACDDGRDPPVTRGDFGQRTPAYLGGLIPVTDVTVSDHAPLPFIVDTGSPITLFNSASFGYAPDYSTTGTSDISAFGIEFSGVPTVTYGAFGPDACGEIPLGGILGGDLLSFFNLTIDYLGSALFLFDHLDGSPDIGQDVDAARSVRFRLEGGGKATVVGLSVDIPATRIIVDGTLEGAEVTFLVDTGASMVTVPKTVFETLGAQDRPRIPDVPVQTVYGESMGFIVRMKSLSVGEVLQNDVPTFVTPDVALFDNLSAEVGTPIAALIGGSFLRTYQTTLRYKARRMELAPYKNPVHINPLEFVSPGFEIAEGCEGGFFVARVYPGTSAAEQGITPGARLYSIESQSLAGLTIDEADRLLKSYEPGSAVQMVLAPRLVAQTYTFVYTDLLPRFGE